MRWQGLGENPWQAVHGGFTICAELAAPRCVVDGDTIRIDERRIRLAGYNAPELAGACEGERDKARAARIAVRDWLNAAPFELALGGRPDKYGRELAQVRRVGGDGLAEHMIASGLAEAYDGQTARRDWCA